MFHTDYHLMKNSPNSSRQTSRRYESKSESGESVKEIWLESNLITFIHYDSVRNHPESTSESENRGILFRIIEITGTRGCYRRNTCTTIYNHGQNALTDLDQKFISLHCLGITILGFSAKIFLDQFYH